jgi:MFS transporter, DHA1 family, inner membrane transport protein
MANRFATSSLMLGNFVIGTSVLAPTGMMHELSEGLGVSIRQTSYLMTFGALVVSLGSPLLSWATSRWDRRVLLVGSLGWIAVAEGLASVADSFALQLALRLLMLVAAAPFTPQAASVAGLLAGPERRASSIAYVFLGWSLAAAFGMPLVALVSSRLGWHWTYGAIAMLAGLSALAVRLSLPPALHTPPVQLASWAELARDPQVLLLLLLTTLVTSGQFAVFTFLAPLLARLAHASADTVGLVFALSGTMGFVGNVLATRIVRDRGAFRTEQLSMSMLVLGAAVFAFSGGSFALMVLGVGIWGLGFASTNSMQQARLVQAAPLLAGAAVSLNTSFLYVGQAAGSAVGGWLFEAGRDAVIGYGALVFIVAGAAVLLFTRPVSAEPRPA